MLHCVSACLANAGVVADTHLVLSDYWVKKLKHADFDATEAEAVYATQVLPAVRVLNQDARQVQALTAEVFRRRGEARAHRALGQRQGRG